MNIQAIWLAYQEMLVRYLRRLTQNQAEAEDLAQTVFLRALENVEHVAALPETHIKAWLMRTGYNAFIDSVRKGKRQVALTEQALPSYEEDFSGVHVQQLMGRLPPNLREVVRLRHLEGYTSAQIGDMLGLPPATVRTRLRAALMVLRQYERKEM